MKTPREILFKQHRAVEPKLDSIRREVVAGIKGQARPARAPLSLRQIILSLRWHLAGMTAIWLFILFLKMDTSHSPGLMAAVPAAHVPPPQVILTSLRENRRQLSEMVGNESHDAEDHKLFLLRPRSERQQETLMA